MSGHLVLGLGGTVDHELRWDQGVVQGLVDTADIGSAELEREGPLATQRDVLVALLRFVARSAGGERHVTDKRALRAFEAHFTYEVTLGGTCVRSAICLAKIGFRSTVHLVSTSDEVRQLLPPEVSIVSSADRDTVDPHLIVQYPKGTHVRLSDGVEVRSTRPNRVILVNDEPNELMRLSPDLPGVLSEADAFLISGLNTMKSSTLLRGRLLELKGMMAGMAQGVPVVYEDAGFHNPPLRSIVLELIPDIVAVHSLNEDEAQDYIGRNVDLERAESLVSMMGELRGLLRASTIVVHTSHYVAVMGADAARMRLAAEEGCVMAGARFLRGDAITETDLRRVASEPLDPLGKALARDSAVCRAGILIAPSREVRTTLPTTIGLGDSFMGGFMKALVVRGSPLVPSAANAQGA